MLLVGRYGKVCSVGNPCHFFSRDILDRQQGGGEGAAGRAPAQPGEARRIARWGIVLIPIPILSSSHPLILSSSHPPSSHPLILMSRPRMRGFTLGGFRFRFGIVFHTVHQVRWKIHPNIPLLPNFPSWPGGAPARPCTCSGPCCSCTGAGGGAGAGAGGGRGGSRRRGRGESAAEEVGQQYQ